jgi:outer membrane protein OmpA-like peptidoglycan-associated protein
MVHFMRLNAAISSPFPSRLAFLVLASAIAIPALAQQSQSSTTPQSTPPSATQPSPAASSTMNTPQEGFWGRVNIFARKKWVKKQTDPINDRLTELDGINAKNANDIKDVDGRAQAGIQKAQSAADSANQVATAAGTQAQNANGIAQGASGHVDQLNTTVKGLDQYHQTTEAEVAFRGGSPILSAAAKKDLDDLAASLTGKQGYILEVEGHSPLGGSAGILSSERLTEAVKRYLVTEHEIPVYRMHAVALGNAHGQTDDDSKPVHTSSVHVRLMENSLAAQGASPPHDDASSTGAERP